MLYANKNFLLYKNPECTRHSGLKSANNCLVLLSSRLYCRYRNLTDSTAEAGRGLSPPVGNSRCQILSIRHRGTHPRRIIFFTGHIITQSFPGYKYYFSSVIFDYPACTEAHCRCRLQYCFPPYGPVPQYRVRPPP